MRIVDIEDAELILHPVTDGVVLTDRDGEEIATLDAIPAAADLRRISRWWRIKNLRNRDSRVAHGVAIEIVEPQHGETTLPKQGTGAPLDPDGTLRLSYGVENGQPVPPGRFLRLRNTTSWPLYCVLLDLTERFKIDGDLFRYGRIEPCETAAAYEGQVVDFVLPPDLENKPGSSYRDWLMLIVSTDEIDARPYEMPALDSTRRDIASRHSTRAPITGDWWTCVLKVVTGGP